MGREYKQQPHSPGKLEPNLSRAIAWLHLVLSLLIVFLHVNFEVTNGTYIALKKVVNVAADCAVPAFFCVSAYLAFRNYSLEKYFSGLGKKCRTILLPYLVWSALGILFQECLSLLTTRTLMPVSLMDLLLCEYNGPLWFLRALFGYVIASPVLYFVAKRKWLAIAVMLGMTLCNFFFYIPTFSMTFWLPVYLLGAFCGVNGKDFFEGGKLANWRSNRGAKVIAAVLLVLAIGFGVTCYEKNGYYLYRILSGILIIGCFILKRWNKTPPSLLQNSFFTFCAHALLLGSKKVFLYIFGTNTPALLCGYVICAGAVWCATVLAAEVLKKWLPKIHGILAGGRKNIEV